MTIPPELEAQILRYHHVEKWRVGTIARQLHVHHGTVTRVLAQAGLPRTDPPRRRSQVEPYLPFIFETLQKFPALTASHGHTVLFTSAGQLLGDLAALDSDSALRRRLRHYARPDLLAIDEVGYLSYSNRHADLLFELVSRRYENKSTMITTNRPFAEWRHVFPNAACVVSLVDRLVHNAEILAIDGDSYRLKEAQERSEQRAHKRRRTKS